MSCLIDFRLILHRSLTQSLVSIAASRLYKPLSLTYLSNTPTNLCIALLNFLLFCFILYCYAFVQYCYVKWIQYNATQYNAIHKFVGVLDNPQGPSSLRFAEIYRGLTGDKRIEIAWNKACLPSAQYSPVRPGWFKWFISCYYIYFHPFLFLNELHIQRVWAACGWSRHRFICTVGFA